VSRLAARIRRVEQLLRLDGGSCGPGCPPWQCVRAPDFYAGRSAVTGEAVAPEKPPKGCANSGRPARVVKLVRDRDFFKNAAHFAEREQERSKTC
jgi:hypothetical protein